MCFEITLVLKKPSKKITDNNRVVSHGNLTSADSNVLTYMREKKWEL